MEIFPKTTNFKQAYLKINFLSCKKAPKNNLLVLNNNFAMKKSQKLSRKSKFS